MNSETTSTTAVLHAPSTPAPERSQATSPKFPRRDDEFYCQDIVFLVEDVLFKVLRWLFEQESEVFSGMFALPPVNSPYGVEGSSDDNPIKLWGVTEDEFKALLWVMFRSGYGSSHMLTQSQWVSVLRLSTMWFFRDIRMRAIAELSKLVSTPTTRIVLARTHNIPRWTEPALSALARQDVPLSAQDLEALVWDAAAKLVQIRESVMFAGLCVCGCNYCTVAHGPRAAPEPRSGATLARVHGSRPGHAHVGQSVGLRVGHAMVAVLRKKTDFSQQIRALFGTALY